MAIFFSNFQQAAFHPRDFRSTLECDLPTTKIYRFHGSITHPNGEKVPVGKDNLLLRECLLKNTTFVEGLIVYAGKESKAMLNNRGPRYVFFFIKHQSVESYMYMSTQMLSLVLVIIYRKSSIRSRLPIQVYSIRGQTL